MQTIQITTISVTEVCELVYKYSARTCVSRLQSHLMDKHQINRYNLLSDGTKEITEKEKALFTLVISSCGFWEATTAECIIRGLVNVNMIPPAVYLIIDN